MNIRPMTDVEKRAAARSFVKTWTGRGDEKQDAQNFWRQLLSKVYGVEDPETDVLFEYPIKNIQTGSTIFIDAYIKDTSVLIEQKGMDVALKKHYKQSDGSMLTPFQQAHRYAGLLPHNMNPRWIVVSNFQEFHIHDMNNPNGEPYVVLLSDLEKEYPRLNFLVDTGNENLRREMEISKKAGDLVGLLYDALLKKFGANPSQADLHSLNVLCVRLVFCLYAEDAGIFEQHLLFHDYLKQFQPRQVGDALERLFSVLDQTEEERPRFLAESDPLLAAFPYVNGGLFKGKVDVPPFDDKLYELLLSDASAGFDWSEISPTIFGAMFESTLNPETRRKGGMHYTSIENIHKVIDPLFLDDLKSELEAILSEPVQRTKTRKLEAFHTKLASLEFLDPAAGSGNFLTESYLSLRRLENRVILEKTGGQIVMGAAINPIRVSITQFHGIEINDFAVTVARTALWIAESQMMKETEDIVHMELDFLPLKTQANIVEGNALRIDWESVVDKSRLSYIMGNPPFGGHQQRSKEQADDMKVAFHDLSKHGKLDYVCAWYAKAAEYMHNSSIVCAFVSTNSICQGESVGILWKYLFEEKGAEILFAYQSFQWASESNDAAAVACVIVGYSVGTRFIHKKLFLPNDQIIECDHINGYLFDTENIYIQSRGKPLTTDMPTMTKGSQPTDGGNLILCSEEKDRLIAKYPSCTHLIKQYISGDDYIYNRIRYCLWLKDASPAEYNRIPEIMDRLRKVAEKRAASPTASVRKDAETPMLFTQIRQPDTDFLAIPEVSSEKRKYIPIGYLTPDVVPSNKLYTLPGATLYIFGVLISNAHMGWMRTVAGRLEMRYSYSPAVYNNFPWPTPTDAQRQRIETTAQGILDARAMFPDCSLADLYNEVTMPPELRKAHQANDVAVLAAYGIKKGDPAYGSESACVAFLMKRCQELITASTTT